MPAYSGGETQGGEPQALGAGPSPALKRARSQGAAQLSRGFLTKDGFIQGYNAQAAVDGAKQIIVAHGLTQSMSDCPQLVPLVDAVRVHLGRKAGRFRWAIAMRTIC